MPCSDCSPTFSALPKLRQCKLMSRVRSNQSPIASERVQFSELVSHAEEELVKYGQAIARLHELIIALENERENLKGEIHVAKSLMAPIRKLPCEILREVFIANGAVNVLTTRPGDTKIPGSQLTSVCSHWRWTAINTTGLWSNIRIEMYDNPLQPADWHVESVRNIIMLSRQSKLDISIYALRQATTPPACLSLLCDQAYRWQCLDGVIMSMAVDILDTLSSVQGRLKSLKTCTIIAPFHHYSAWIEGAQELRKARVQDTNLSKLNIGSPWNRIMELEIEAAESPHVAQLLNHLRGVRSLRVSYPFYRSYCQDHNQQPVHSNLQSLTLLIRSGDNELQMTKLLDMLTLPKLDSFYIISEVPTHITNQAGISWSSNELPSLISRSSASITSLSLNSVWVPTKDLLALLKSIPSLTSLFLREPSHENPDISPMLESRLLSFLCLKKNRQPVLTRIASLTLDGCQLVSDFSIPLFIKVIQSRWKPSSEDIACIKNVRLVVVDAVVPRKDIQSLVMLRKRGLDISIKDKNGKVPLWEE